MKIASIETFLCDAGWRAWMFVKITTDEGLVGWSECTDSHGSPRGIAGVIKDLEPAIVGKDPRMIERIYWDLYRLTRQSPGGIAAKAIAGIENALLDIKAKALGVPVYEMLGGPIRERLKLYWSHCGTTRARAAHHARVPPLSSFADIHELAKEVKAKGYTALKTNLIFFALSPWVYMPGFAKSAGGPELNVDRKLLRGIEEYVSVWRSAVGGEFGLILDLNFNFKTEGYLEIARVLEPYRLMWLELDSYDPEALLEIRRASKIPICSGENLYGSRAYRPYFERHAMDIASVDICWNGLLQSKKIADLAELYEMNIAPHNHHSHLATFISAHFSALIPNLRILEIDVDDVPWKDDMVTEAPKIENGHLILPTRPGWGADIREEVLREHPWKGTRV